MAVEVPGHSPGICVAGEIIPAYRLLTIGSADFTLVLADSGHVLGASRSAADQGQAVELDTDGTVKLEVGSAGVSRGPVKCVTDGKIETSATTTIVVGMALEDGSDGDIVTVQLGSKGHLALA